MKHEGRSDSACACAAPYALLVKLQGEPVVVVGAGAVGARKICTLIEHGADVRVIAPDAADEVRTLADAGCIKWERRRYRQGDLQGALLAVVATDDRDVSEAAFAEAQSRHVLVNVVDVPDLCTFIVPSVMKRGQFQVAVSTNGAAPSVAREVRRELEERFPSWWADYIDLLGEVRAIVKERVPGGAAQRAKLFEAVGSARLEDRVAAGEHMSAESVYNEVVAPLLEDDAQ